MHRSGVILCKTAGGGWLERLCGLRGVLRSVKGGFYFHRSDEGLSPGIPERKKPFSSLAFPLQQLENRYLCGWVEIVRSQKRDMGHPAGSKPLQHDRNWDKENRNLTRVPLPAAIRQDAGRKRGPAS